MAGLDTWNPEDKELDKAVSPEPDAPGAMRRMEELRSKKRFLSRQKEEKKVANGHCGYCALPCPREYCGSSCEKQAAFASMGGALNFYEETE